MTTACSMSPLASVNACLQSIIGAPVFSRRSFTCAAEIFTVVAPIKVSQFAFLVSSDLTDVAQATRNWKPDTRRHTINNDPRRTTRAGLLSMPGLSLATGHSQLAMRLNRLALYLRQIRVFVRDRLFVRSRAHHFFHADVLVGINRRRLCSVLLGGRLSRLRLFRPSLHHGNLFVGH